MFILWHGLSFLVQSLDAGHRGSEGLAQKVGSAALNRQVSLTVWGQDPGQQLDDTHVGIGQQELMPVAGLARITIMSLSCTLLRIRAPQ